MYYKAAYVHFGTAPGPFQTLRCSVRYHVQQRSATKPGPLLSNWQVRVHGKWRNVWISSKAPFPFVRVEGQKVNVQFEDA